MQAVAIDTELLGRSRHELTEPERPLRTYRDGIVSALLNQHRVHQANRESGFASGALNEWIEQAPAFLGRATEKAGR